jgi:hypothetical protein
MINMSLGVLRVDELLFQITGIQLQPRGIMINATGPAPKEPREGRVRLYDPKGNAVLDPHGGGMFLTIPAAKPGHSHVDITYNLNIDHINRKYR